VVVRGWFAAAVVANVVVTVTGGIVRITGSGLGCPTWPECVDGSVVPTGPVVVLPAAVEFGNRLVGVGVGAVAIGCLVAALTARRRRRAAVGLAAANLSGVIAQGALGGVTVLTGLHPATVSAHLLLSVGLIAVAVAGYETSSGIPASMPGPRVVRMLGDALCGLAAAIAAVGAVAVGAGRHGGDPAAVRLPVDHRAAVWLHADLVIALFGVLLALWVAANLTATSPPIRRRLRQVTLIALAQGIGGVVQYLAGMPRVAAVLHVAGACLLVVAVTRLRLALHVSGPAQRAATPEPSPTYGGTR
jgi:cytochrome c oxidase assembly protein subunit 15